eukprot:CAMPEP_0174740832 /NCGR_PEP_ID=MMETSP1094-20130205/74611_1 /TAXON_ID=156173 /ORGANISM="Chrysochromulina brevifilum, Strain UTEX LB 985" /LENGTH=63 /DNA_ID=CAMNT_0015944611 /DNA_START=5 /DNA_END=192 /DNA_ORIENTATION=+
MSSMMVSPPPQIRTPPRARASTSTVPIPVATMSSRQDLPPAFLPATSLATTTMPLIPPLGLAS